MTGSDRWIVIPRWDEFQHRDMARSSVPPWIKNMTRLLHDEDYLALSLMQRGVLHGIWLMYASHRRVLSEAEARRELGRSAGEARRWRDTIEALSHAGFILIVAGRPARHLASLEVEVEVEVESEGSTRSSQKTPPHLARPDTRANGDIAPIGSIFEQILAQAAGQIPAPHTHREGEE